MNVWEEVSQDVRHRRLSPIGETRWWAKDAALSKVFGKFGDPEKCLIDLIVTLMAIMDQEKVPHRQCERRQTVAAKCDIFLRGLVEYIKDGLVSFDLPSSLDGLRIELASRVDRHIQGRRLE
ncbi:hypothetical protein NHX12_008802 [Muraenolepis orangiensis]|nr:hypothetical protein NHX12_008802 [Muraenolepis orangiensis]